MTARPKRYMTEEEYIEFEVASPRKHEYYQGDIFAMTGGTEPHNLLAGNAYASLHAQLRRRPCRVYPSDQRIKVLTTGLHTYPDVTVVCGQPQFIEASRLTITNPTVIIEVLSPSTERYDRGMKFQQYRTIPSFQDYILIAQDDHRIEHFTRQEHGIWLLYEAIGITAHVSIRSIDCVLAIEDVYEKVELAPNKTGITREAAKEECDE
ncbi:Uma2 family endonuclease [Candidatus Chloroploca sp. M-50]|uniref:Uma2 family endonuclease n=1 Tax=Candidatus Chloroploca mongolica TaxID=2528176 RepID=A0ABS4D8V1_9CHLR|nr:Uma2 family endonuclease [Candidatus Chloroploca mongolica]MBP1465856.1 Uma2 family endonuclease [Candidatus Chloroploca mongolica]